MCCRGGGSPMECIRRTVCLGVRGTRYFWPMWCSMAYVIGHWRGFHVNEKLDCISRAQMGYDIEIFGQLHVRIPITMCSVEESGHGGGSLIDTHI